MDIKEARSTERNTKLIDRFYELTDPGCCHDAIDVDEVEEPLLLAMYEKMVEIRLVEYTIASLVKQGIAKCPCHLSIGQEAIPVALSLSLDSGDKLFGNHRSHGHFLAQGGTSQSLLSEVLGKVSGCSGGMGGSMHLIAIEEGFYGSVPIVAGTVPIAVGAAVAAKMDKSRGVVISYFGDGAMEEGSVHESMNLASTLQLPILFVCENNFYSSHLDLLQRQPSRRLSRFAEAHCLEHRLVDGNDVVEIWRVGQELVKNGREKRQPAFIEALTFRHCGHVGANEDIDVGVGRELAILQQWKKRDPIERLGKSLDRANILTFVEQRNMRERIEERLTQEVKEAMDAPYPSNEALLKSVYST